MQSKTWIIAAVLAAVSSPALAQNSLHCMELDETKPGEATRAFDCIEKLDTDLKAALVRIDDLEQQIADIGVLSGRLNAMQAEITKMSTEFVPAIGEHPETKAIVAYYSAKGEKVCPKGWVPFEDAKDRFILGAGTGTRAVGRTGGEASVKLEIEHMPAHSHIQVWGQNSGNEATVSGNNLQAYPANSIQRTRETGGSQPHNNIPPFIALYFCQPKSK